MDWVWDVLRSEFLWGLILGLLLSIVVAAVTLWLQDRRKRLLVLRFCQDLIDSVCDQIDNLENHRERTRVIHHDFLSVIQAEITVYARNREHLVQIHDQTLRRDVVKFFARAAGLLAQIGSKLQLFSEAHAFVQQDPDTQRQQQTKNLANNILSEAHNICDKLRELSTQKQDLTNRISKYTSRAW